MNNVHYTIPGVSEGIRVTVYRVNCKHKRDTVVVSWVIDKTF